MAFDPLSAGITAGSSLIGGVLGNWAENLREKQRAISQAIQDRGKAGMEGSQLLGQNQQNAFNQLIAAYRSAFS